MYPLDSTSGSGRLKTRQRLSKINALGPTPAPLAPEIKPVPPDDKNSSHLASKIRVSSLINQSIPDMKYDIRSKDSKFGNKYGKDVGRYKIKSHVTAQDIEDFQRKENTPYEIDGQLYRIHPATIPEPEFEEVPDESQISGAVAMRSQKETEIASKVVTIKQLRTRLATVNAELVRLDKEFNEQMSKPPPRIDFVNLLDANVSVSDLYNLDKRAGMIKYEEDRKRDQEQYYEIKEALEGEKADIISRLDYLKADIDSVRDEIQQFDEQLPEEMSKIRKAREENKAKLAAYVDNLKSVNRTFSLVQEPYESQEQYLERIREQTQAINDPNLLTDRFNLYEGKRFRDNMKEIIRDTSTIETAYNTLFQEDNSSIPEVNKIFALIKSRYEKIYGTVQLNDMDFIQFLKKMLENPEEQAIKQEEEQALTAGAGRNAEKYASLLATDRFDKRKQRFTLSALRGMIKDLFDDLSDGPSFTFSTEILGETSTISKGSREAYIVDTAGSRTNLNSTGKPKLVGLYVGLMEKLKQLDPTEYATRNKAVNAKTNDEYGEGIKAENLPKSCKLGKININLDKLYHKNILSINQNGMKINGVKNMSVGDEFVKMMLDLCKGSYPSTKILQKLPPVEMEAFDALMFLAGLQKRVEHTANKTVELLKARLPIIEGEIQAGNTNKMLYSEIKDIVFKLHHLGEITQNQATDYLKQFAPSRRGVKG